MKQLLTTFAALSAAPAFAHDGVHMHPHASDPSWAALMVATIVGAGAVTLLWMRNK